MGRIIRSFEKLPFKKRLNLILVIGAIIILIGFLIVNLYSKKLLSEADVGNTVQNVATSTYQDSSGKSYSSASNTVLIDIISEQPTWQHPFTTSTAGWVLASFPHAVNKPVGSIFDLASIPDTLQFLHKYDPVNQGYITFSEANQGNFGNISWSDGMWINFTGINKTVSYQATELTTAQHIDLKGKSWYLIGYPFTNPMLLDSLEVHELDASGQPIPGSEKTFDQATDTLVQQPVIGYDPAMSSYIMVTTTTYRPSGDKHQLEPWQGYWLYVFAPNGIRIIYPSQIKAGGQAVPSGLPAMPEKKTKEKKK